VRRARRGFLATGLHAAAALPAALGSRPVPGEVAAPAVDEPFAFALIGDIPYSRLEEMRLEEILERLADDRLALVIHVGDLKAGREACSDDLLAVRRAMLDRSAHPLVLTPGDNDWTDCHRHAAGGYDPLERLRHLRATFFASPTAMGLRPLAVERQPGFPENARWRIGRVAFLTMHVVGSNDGYGEYPGSEPEWLERSDANDRWLEAGLAGALADRAEALVLAIHANPGFGTRLRPAHVPTRRLLVEAARRFERPILFLHGDTHRFRVDQPLHDDDGRHYPQFTRVESFGSPFASSWVRIAYEPSLPERFVVTMRSLL
jgi:hypothetical protein